MWILYVFDKVNLIRSTCSMSSDWLTLMHINAFHRVHVMLFYFQVCESNLLLSKLCILNGLLKHRLCKMRNIRAIRGAFVLVEVLYYKGKWRISLFTSVLSPLLSGFTHPDSWMDRSANWYQRQNYTDFRNDSQCYRFGCMCFDDICGFCGFVFLRWPIRMVVFSLRLLLQEPQERAWGWERHFLQRALHFLFRDPIGSQLSAGNGHCASRHPPVQHQDSGPAGEKGSDPDSQEDWSAPRSNRRAAWRHGGKEETGQREADSGAGAG